MKFKCKHTGQIYEYSSEQDIKEMLKHDEYLAITEEAVQEVVQEPTPKPVKQAKKKETE